MQWPLLLPLLSGIAGLCTRQVCNISPPWWTLAAALIPFLAACFTRSRLPFVLAAALFFFTWGELSLERALEQDPRWRSFVGPDPVLVEAVVDGRPEGVDGGSRLYLKVERLRLGVRTEAPSGRILLRVGQGKPPFCSGDTVLFSSRLKIPRRYGLPGERDYPRFLALKGVAATAFVKDGEDLVLLSPGEGWQWRVDRLALRLGRFIDDNVGGTEGAMLKALLLADTADVPAELKDAYARSGVNHILSISGFHVGILFVALFQALFLGARCFETLALRLNLRRSLLLAALPVTVCYLFLSGAAPATVRSVLMIAGCTAALFLNREVHPVQVIMLAACAMVAVHPQALFDVSFQLSFLAVWGLVVLTPLLVRPFPRMSGPLKWLLHALCASAAAILSTLVPVAYYFQRVSFTGLACNLVVVPLMGYGAVVLGFLGLLLSFVLPQAARVALVLAGHAVRWSDQAVTYCAAAPVFTAYQPHPRDLVLSCLILAALTFLRRPQLRLISVVTLLCALVYGALPESHAADGSLRIVFLSVGQGDSALLRLPDGKTMLIDGGGNAGEGDTRVGERLLIPALRSLGVRRIDYLVLSHPHPDHCQGLLPVAAQFEVGEFWESGLPSGQWECQALRWIVAARGMPVRRLDASTPRFLAGGALVETLWPPAHSVVTEDDDANDSCLSVRISCGRASVLFAADLGEEQERQLLQTGAPLKATVLKVAHHGSRYSSCDDFLRACAPQAAVISAGYGNRFHLPAPATVARLQHRGIVVYRTDLEGSVQARLWSDGRCEVATPWGNLR